MYRLFPILILLTACSENSPPQDAASEAEDASVDLAFCQGQPFADTIGQPVSTIQAELPERSRVLGPDDIATQDYRIDRLNVYVNGSGIIQRLTCG
ncbi:I78 family peptidase inhibitor [uncultured Ruegeria sp.]|uniref:I78 family peptidase inhibitor n=1 Tax=uncultured Ruegeria sp. TaxID=259304 RepID=UPI002612FACB|nr:I78 family peptidase inhibitor [uncultured Ruegeria sp.]